MMVQESFPGDRHVLLKRIQFASFTSLAEQLYLLARSRYLEAQDSLGVDTPLARQARALPHCNPKALLPFCEQLAAHYRFRRSDAAQMLLLYDETGHEAWLTSSWQNYFSSYATKVANTSRLCAAILKTAVSWGTPDELTAQKDLTHLFSHKYGDVRVMAREDLRRGPTRRTR